MSVLLGQSYYLLNDYRDAATIMMGVANAAEKGGRTPDENWLQIVLSSQFKLDNKDGIAEALKLVRYYPKGVLGEPARHLSAQGHERSRHTRLL